MAFFRRKDNKAAKYYIGCDTHDLDNENGKAAIVVMVKTEEGLEIVSEHLLNNKPEFEIMLQTMKAFYKNHVITEEIE